MSVTPSPSVLAPAAPRAANPTAAPAASDEDFGALVETAAAEDAGPVAEAAIKPRPDDTADAAKADPDSNANTGLLDGATAMAMQPQPAPQAVLPPEVETEAAPALQVAETSTTAPDPVSTPVSTPPVPTAPSAATAAAQAAAALAAQEGVEAAPADSDGEAPTAETADAEPAEARPLATSASNASAAVTSTPNSLGAAGSRFETRAAAPANPVSSSTGDATSPSATSAMAGAAPGQTPAPASQASTSPPVVAPLLDAPAATPATASTQPTAPIASTPATAAMVSLSSLSHATVETTVQIAAQITRRLEGKSTRFEMALTPEGLGRVDVSLDIDADGQLAARLAFDNPLAATELRGRADELRRQLQDAGFTLAGDALDFSQRDGSASSDGFDRRQGGRAFANASRTALDADAGVPPPAAWMSLNLTPRGVDMKV